MRTDPPSSKLLDVRFSGSEKRLRPFLRLYHGAAELPNRKAVEYRRLPGYSPRSLIDDALVSYGDLVCPEDAPQLKDDIQSAIARDVPKATIAAVSASSSSLTCGWWR